MAQFKPAPRETPADLANDMKAVQRKLDRVLYLLVKKARQEHAWQMPQGGLEEGESLAQVPIPRPWLCCVSMCALVHNLRRRVQGNFGKSVAMSSV